MEALGTALVHLRALLITGSDARSFLQAQLSANIDGVQDQQAVMAAMCALNGRVIGLGWLATTDTNQFVWVVHESQALSLRDGLLKYRLRAKCTIALDSRTLINSADGEAALRLPDARALSLQSHARIDRAAQHAWQLADIAQCYPSNGGGERFLPQMLGLEKLGGLSLKKGCFPGQEVIARLHYKGELKKDLRRMRCEHPVAIGRYRLADRVEEVDVIQSADDQLLVVCAKQLDAQFAIMCGDQNCVLQTL